MSDDRIDAGGEGRADEGEALEREFADVLGALRGFEPVGAPPTLEERIAMKLKAAKDQGAAAVTGAEAIASRGPEPGVSLRCVFCHERLARAEGAFCASCLAPHHPECFREHGRCGAPACEETRWVQPRDRGRRPSERAGRSSEGKRRAPTLAFVGAGLLASVVAAAAVRIVNAPVAAPVRDEQAMFEEYKRLDALAMKALRGSIRAEKAGDAALAGTKHQEAHALWTRAIEVLNGILDAHRGPDGFALPEYEGYEEELSRVAQHLVDLEKRALHASPLVADALARARQRLAAGDVAGARADVDRARKLDPNSAEAKVLLAELEAVAPAAASEERELEPTFDELDARAYVARARERLEAGRLAEARADLHRARELDPGCVDVLRLLSEVEAVASGAAVDSSGSPLTLLDGLERTVVEAERLMRRGDVAQAEVMIEQGRWIVRVLRRSTDDAVHAALPPLERRLDRVGQERRTREH